MVNIFEFMSQYSLMMTIWSENLLHIDTPECPAYLLPSAVAMSWQEWRDEKWKKRRWWKQRLAWRWWNDSNEYNGDKSDGDEDNGDDTYDDEQHGGKLETYRLPHRQQPDGQTRGNFHPKKSSRLLTIHKRLSSLTISWKRFDITVTDLMYQI